MRCRDCKKARSPKLRNKKNNFLGGNSPQTQRTQRHVVLLCALCVSVVNSPPNYLHGKPIALTVYGDDEAGIRRIILDLLPQPRDMNVHRTRHRRFGVAPDLL
jgi:hypothetical protein